MTREKALQLMQVSLDSLQRSGVTKERIEVSSDTVILGSRSSLDSLGFVTFISDLEERVSSESGREHYLVLGDIHTLNADQTFLSAAILADYIERITQ
jgi:hypothetical protein